MDASPSNEIKQVTIARDHRVGLCGERTSENVIVVSVNHYGRLEST